MPDEQAASKPTQQPDAESKEAVRERVARRRKKRKKEKPVRDARYFYENTRWRLISTAVWVVLVIAGLVAVVLSGMSVSDDFGGEASLTNMLQTFLLLGMLVPPMVLIIAAGGLDLSIAGVAALAGGLLSLWAGDCGPQAALWRALGIAAGVGLVNGLLVALFRIHGAVVTLGSLFACLGVTSLLGVGGSGGGAESSEAAADQFGSLANLGDSAIPWIALAVCAVIGIVLAQFTPMGRRPKPGEVREPVEGGFARCVYTAVPYLLSGLAAGAVGVYATIVPGPELSVLPPGLPAQVALLVATAAVLGGTPVGGGHGTVLGGLIACLLVVAGLNVAQVHGLELSAIIIGAGGALLAAALLTRMYFGLIAWRFDRK
jgi:ribose transport system permease protein